MYIPTVFKFRPVAPSVSKITAIAAVSSLFAFTLGAVLYFFVLPLAANADSIGPINFESPIYTPGPISGQDGWTASGASGSGCAVYDEGVANSLGKTGFDAQSFRISDAVTSGCFGDQAFAKPMTDSVGEAAATAGTFAVGTLQPHFEMQFDIASTVPDAQQPGMHLSVSPDRGDGSRMSYLRFEDQSDGIHVFFDDVTDVGPLGTVAIFNDNDVGTISRSPHTIKLTMDTVDGPGNDVVKVYIDGSLVHTGTSWEDYYRYDPEAAGEQSPRIVKTVLFRESGEANTNDAGKGFLIDNLLLSFGPIPSATPTPTPTPSAVSVHIYKYIDGVQATAANANSVDFPMVKTFNSTTYGSATDAAFTLGTAGWGTDPAYRASFANANVGADYATHEVTGGPVVGADCSTGQPFALVGYSVGATLEDAATATPSPTAPDFKNLQNDEYVIVQNHFCTSVVTLAATLSLLTSAKS